jgi:hypothetical protein
MTASVAAIADAPQMAVPTPIKVRVSPRRPSIWPVTHAIKRAAASVPSKTGIDRTPIERTWPSDSPKPIRTTEACSTFFEVNAMPALRRAEGFVAVAMAMPERTANTGAPTTGARPPSSVANAATAAAQLTPGTSTRKPPSPLWPRRDRDMGFLRAAGLCYHLIVDGDCLLP